MATLRNSEDSEEPRSARGSSRLAIPAAFLLIDVAFLYWVWVALPNWGIWDWDFYQTLLEAARSAIVDHHQVPLWNPFLNGGFTLVGHPQVRAFNPSFLVILAFGTIPGIKLCILLYLLVAQWGAFRLARAEGLSEAAAFLAAIVFSLCGWYAQHIAHGHFTWVGFAWTPFVALAITQAAGGLRARPLVVGGFCLGLAVLDGGPYEAGFLPVFMGLYAGAVALRSRTLRPFYACAVLGAVGAAIAAVQIVPIAETYVSFPRRTAAVNYFYGAPFEKAWFEILYQGFLSRAQAHDPGQWMPYVLNVGTYVGWLPVILAGAALALRPAAAWPLGAVFAIATWIYLGSAARPDLWALLHKLPILGSLQVPARFNVFAALPLALLAAHGLDTLRGALAGRWRWLAVAAPAVVALDMGVVNGPVFRVAFSIPPVDLREPGEFFHHINSPHLAGWRERAVHPVFSNWPGVAYASTLENTGVLRAWNNLGYPRHAVARSHPSYRGEVYPAGEDDVHLHDVVVTPNEIRFSVSGSGGRVVINQNHRAGWKVVSGEGELKKLAGLVAVRVPAGEQAVRVAFRPRSFRIGASVSALALLAAAATLASRRTAPA